MLRSGIAPEHQRRRAGMAMTDAILGHFDLTAEIARFQPQDSVAGRRAETLVKDERLRVVLVTMRQGTTLDEHTAPGPITIQALRGRLAVVANGTEHALAVGGLLALATGVRHSVQALEDAAFLLTIGWSERGGG
jgi:quercetin dioxygenase-like cupin family protein